MTAHAEAAPAEAVAPRPTGAGRVRQITTLVRRNLTHIKRQPEMLTDVTIQPVMFVLLFAYVFGGSIQIPGVDYKPWLLPGIMAQTIAFSAFIVAIGLNTDIGKGMVDRLRSLPIRRSSILISRSIAALIHSSIGVAVMSVTGLFIGWRLHDGVVNALVGYGLLELAADGAAADPPEVEPVEAQADRARAAVAARVSARPEVNHNYEREHRLNLWFVVAAADAPTAARSRAAR